MPSSFEAMHDETRSLTLLETEDIRPAALPPGLTLLSAVLILVPVVVAFLL